MSLVLRLIFNFKKYLFKVHWEHFILFFLIKNDIFSIDAQGNKENISKEFKSLNEICGEKKQVY